MDIPPATPTDNPGVIARPPLVYAAAFCLVLVLRWLWPMPILGSAVGIVVGVALFVLATAFAIWGRRALKAAGTNVNPAFPTTAIVTSGPYRFTRNPLYIALTIAYSGLTLAANTWWGVVMLAPLLAVIHVGVVLREERYLDHKFGDHYRRYRAAVRRYL
jgi:protein-S-isoprenylcysteine O-methyltransferase Ste14